MSLSPACKPLEQSGTVIGVTGKYRDDTVKLLAQHDANQLMRPGERPERQNQIRLLGQWFGLAVGTGYGGDQRLAAPGADLADSGRQILGGQGLAPPVEQD